MKRLLIRLALIVGVASATGGAWAQTLASPDRMRVTVRPAHAAGPLCDRREVGECQDTARARAIMCDAFADRLSCADAVLRAQSACFRDTRCD